MKRYSGKVIFLIMVICLGYAVQNRWKSDNGEGWKHVIGSDGYGYYAYLPCVFIYHHLDYNRAKAEENVVVPGAEGFVVALPQNRLLDKWFPGVAILLIPFFLVAYWVSLLLGYSTGGYEFPFQASVSIGALFYLATGLVFIRKLLKEYGIPERIISFVLLVVVFGTNLLYYATMEPSMSHVYSFGLTAVFLFYTKKSVTDFNLKNLAPMCISICLLALIRPTNLISIIFIPVLAGSYKATVSFLGKFFQSPKSFVLLLIGFLILGIQLELWYLQTGHFFVWSYQKEGFNFSHPHFFDILFSYQNGWYVYTPVMFIATSGGLLALYRQSIFRFFTMLSFFVTVTYVLSSWWAWWYGAAYGLRAFVDFYPIFVFILALFLNGLRFLWSRVIVGIAAILCIALNLFQTMQYNRSILPIDNVTKEKYWKVFLKDAPSYNGLFDYPDTTGFKFFYPSACINGFESDTANAGNYTTRYAHSGLRSFMIGEHNPYSPAFVLNDSLMPKTRPLYAYIKLWVFMPDFDNNAAIIVNLQNKKGQSYLWTAQTLQGYALKKNVWSYAYALVNLPPFKSPSDELTVYALNTGHNVYIDDLELVFGVPQ